MTFTGRCQCGAVGYEFHASRPPGEWAVRACQCSFCRGHGARTTSDAQGNVRFTIPDPTKVNRYRFASRSAEFLLCRECGTYVASVVDAPRGRFATLNVNLISPAVEVPAAAAMSYDRETPAEKQARRERIWTPVIDFA